MKFNVALTKTAETSFISGTHSDEHDGVLVIDFIQNKWLITF